MSQPTQPDEGGSLKRVQGEHQPADSDPYLRNDYQLIADAMMAASDRARRNAPRWQRILWWFLDSDAGHVIIGVPLAFLVFSPVYYFGLWWAILIVVAGFSFALGWNAARRRVERDGYVDKL